MPVPTSDITNPARHARWGAWAIALAACIWGFWGLAIRASGLSGPHVPCIVLATIAIFGIPLLPRRLPRGRAAWFALVATGATDAANALLYFEALSRGPQPVAVLSHYLAPILVALFTPLVLGTRAPRVAFFALPVSVVGLALLLGPDALTLGDALVTGALGAGSAVFYALQILIQKRFSDRLTAGELLVWHAAFGALMLLPFALTAPAPHLGGVLWLMGGAIAGGCVAGTVFLWGLGRVTAATAGVLTYVEPLVGVLVGLVAFGEPLAATAPLGGVLILGAGLWVVRAAARA